MNLSYKTLLRDRNFYLFFLALLVTKIGDKIYIFAIPWLIYEITESSIGVGTMFLVQTLPFIFISPIAGLLADLFSRKKILIICAGSQGLMILLIPLLHYNDILYVWTTYILGFLIACCGACYSVVNGSIIPQLFNKDMLIKVNSVFQFIDTSSVFFGSMFAGILIGIIGVYKLLILDGLAFSIILFLLLLLSFQNEVNNKERDSSITEKLLAGGTFILKHPILGPFTLILLVMNIANGALISMLMFFARHNLDLSSKHIGYVYAVAAAAQFLVIFMIPKINKRANFMKFMFISLIISSFGIILVSISWNWISLAIFIAIQSAPIIMFNVLNRTLRQIIVPNDIYGRVNGLITMLTLGSLPLSGFLTGILADFIDLKYIYLFLGLFSLVIVLKFSLSPLKNFNINKVNM